MTTACPDDLPPPTDLSHLSDEDLLALCPQGEHAPGLDPAVPVRPMLWLKMQEDVIAAPLATRNPAGTIAAAQIRAVRDYIRAHVPGHGWQTWQVRQIVDLLNDEADRAERGT